jgi:flagellar biosynthesis protein FlhF
MAKHEGKTQVFRGKTYTEAVSKAVNKLGKDFSVVKRRDVKANSLFNRLIPGKLGGDLLEVELEVEMANPEAAPEPVRPKPGNHRTYAKAQEEWERRNAESAGAMAAKAAQFVNVDGTAAGVAGYLKAVQTAVEKNRRESADMWAQVIALISLQARGGLPAVSPPLLAHHRALTEAGIEEKLARELVEDAERAGILSPADLEQEVFRAAVRRIPVAAPVLLREDGPAIVALIGPSGMGKSTSLAKLAIQFGVKGGKRVAVVNEDMRRPGADGQMQNLGRLFGLPVATASCPDEMRDAVHSLGGPDLILVDTAGRSPRDAEGIRFLAEILRAAGAHEIHLAVSSYVSGRTMEETAERFRPAGFDRIILTKLDECLDCGAVLNLASRLSNGLSYVTSGPDYSTPILPADGDWLAGFAFGRTERERGGKGDKREGPAQ